MMLPEMRERDALVLMFLLEWGRPLRVGEIKRHLNMPHSTLNSIIKKLEKRGLVDWEEYSNVSLTEKGKKVSSHLLKHHNILHHYLVKVLGIDDKVAHQDSLKTAGLLSCDTIEALRNANETCNLEICKIALKDHQPLVKKEDLEIC